jgi:hypothetical protein
MVGCLVLKFQLSKLDMHTYAGYYGPHVGPRGVCERVGRARCFELAMPHRWRGRDRRHVCGRATPAPRDETIPTIALVFDMATADTGRH